MKKITLSIFTLAALSAAAYGQTLDRSIRPKAGPAPEIKLGKTESFTLPNGLKVFVVENHKLPTVAYSIQLDVRPELEGDMAGYKELVGELMTSGTKTRTNEQLNQQIDQIGADINASAESVFARSLKKHQDKLLALMSDIVMNADFKQAELDKLKTRTLSGLEASKNEPDDMLENVAAATNFGKNHPYGEVPTEETVGKITLERTKKYYSTYFRPNVAYMAVVGDITLAEVKPLVEKYFGNWQKAPVPVATYPTPVAPSEARVVFVPRDAAVQSVINVTYPLDLKPGTPDVIKARVANAILGDGSQGRLFLNLREAHGWTYGSYSNINIDDQMGSFTAYAKCRNAVSDSSVAEIVKEMRRMQMEKVSDEELKNRITYMGGNFAIGLENPQTVAQYAINIERYKMPKDYYQNYLKNLSAVTAEDVQAMAQKYINPDKANIIVVGSKDEVAKKLATFAKSGKVDYTDNYGRSIQVSETAAAPSGMKGDDVLKKYVTAMGGEQALNSVKDIKTISEAELPGGQGKLVVTEIRKAPGKMKMVIQVGPMTMQKVVWDGKAGFVETPQGKMPIKDEEAIQYRKTADIQAVLHADAYGIKREVKGQEGNLLLVEATGSDGKPAKEYYDATTGLLMKEVETEGEDVQTTEYFDYREVPGVKGYKVPYTLVQTGVAPFPLNLKVTAVEVNKNIPDSEFQ